MNEFSMIEKYFAPLSQSRRLDDDTAIISPQPGLDLVVSTDTLNAGRHFSADAKPEDIAAKALRANISDLISSAATPSHYQLSIAFPEKPDESWLQAFTESLAAQQKLFGVTCSGGDTTTIDGPLSISITAMGWVPQGQATTRGGAKAGDVILLSGPIGDAAAALGVHRGTIKTDDHDHFKTALYYPTLRPDLIPTMQAHAHAGIDVSDGFAADLAHMCRASALDAHVTLADIPLSALMENLSEAGKVTYDQILTGGDDYALILAVPADKVALFEGCCRIGVFKDSAGTQPAVSIKDASGEILDLKHTGWSHF